ncbi:hypothetical protein L6R52_07265 [Myxococcota bacterium]|nr:hypothetical protein [Myxococcota bacterium]
MALAPIRVASSFALALFAACASAPPPKKAEPERPAYVDGVRQRPLTVEEVEDAVKRSRERIVACYRTERLNDPTSKLPSFTFEVSIPTDGSAQKVTMTSTDATPLRVLEGCLRDALIAIRFPPHVGTTLVVQVPIQGPE